MTNWEEQICNLCSQLQQQNQFNVDPITKAVRNIALNAIEQNVKILQINPVSIGKQSIPTIRTCIRMYQTIKMMLSLLCCAFVLHTLLLANFGLAPHLMVYTCTSLVTHNYIQYDFISTPSLVKGVACLGLTYISLQRNKGMITGIQQLQNGTYSLQEITNKFYHDTSTTLSDFYHGNRDLSSTQLYQDMHIIVDIVQWIVESVWYTFTHSARDSTRTFIKWINKKTQVIVALRDAFIELPVIKQVREAVKAVEDTVEHHIVRPIRETVRHGVQCLIDGFSYFGKRLIQWGKTSQINVESQKVDVYMAEIPMSVA